MNADHRRLDYVVEHQVLTTSSETHDVEVFTVLVYLLFVIWPLTKFSLHNSSSVFLKIDTELFHYC